MDETPVVAACDRIEAAVTRIEAALAAAGPDQELRRRHDLLREAAASSLLAIDALIGAYEQAGIAPAPALTGAYAEAPGADEQPA